MENLNQNFKQVFKKGLLFVKSSNATILGISLILSATIFGCFFYTAKQSATTIYVTGSANKNVKSDLAKMNFILSKRADFDNVKKSSISLLESSNQLIKVLQKKGFDKASIELLSMSTSAHYENNLQTGYDISQTIALTTKELSKVKEIAINPSALIDKEDISISAETNYYIQDTKGLRLKLIEEATKDAQLRAVAIAKNFHQRVKKLESVRTGVFQFTAPYSADVSDYGIYDASSIEKTANVTVNATFKID